MKLLEIFRFELAYPIRRLSTWLPFAALAVVAFLVVRRNVVADELYADFYVNSPFIIAVATVFCSLFWLLVAAGVAGEVAAREVETGMHPLHGPRPQGRVPGGTLPRRLRAQRADPARRAAGRDARRVRARRGCRHPFRPAACLAVYGFLALPNALLGTAVQFAWATLGRRAIASYVGSAMPFALVYGEVNSEG